MWFETISCGVFVSSAERPKPASNACDVLLGETPKSLTRVRRTSARGHTSARPTRESFSRESAAGPAQTTRRSAPRRPRRVPPTEKLKRFLHARHTRRRRVRGVVRTYACLAYGVGPRGPRPGWWITAVILNQNSFANSQKSVPRSRDGCDDDDFSWRARPLSAGSVDASR